MTLTPEQQNVLESIKEFVKNDASVFILRGYAGTGKTTMVKEIADYISQYKNVVLMAPTGRAARVLTMKTGYTATTIHRAIYSSADLITNTAKDIAESEFKLYFPIIETTGNIVAIVEASTKNGGKRQI